MCGIGASPSIFPVKTAKIAASDTVGFAVSYGEGGSYDKREDEAKGEVSICTEAALNCDQEHSELMCLDSSSSRTRWSSIQGLPRSGCPRRPAMTWIHMRGPETG